LGGVYLYSLVGGDIPPAYLAPRSVLASGSVQRDLGLFFVLSGGYFVINSLLVSFAVALNSERALREVWNWNTRGVLGYDLTASSLAVLVALLYSKFDQTLGFGSVALIGVVFPLIAVRHVYGLYRQLQESGQELLQLMVKAIEARDPYTSGHSVRVSRLSRTIAIELGLPAIQIEQIETAALLHDVGKIHEEFAPLLRKETRLDEAETALMQTHATRSAELVGIISKFRGSVQDAVRYHHERWDGRGYPEGLAGEGIPVGARIILISDTIDAMTTDRPYRRRLPLEVVVAELQKCRGTQFDPRIVDVTVSSVAVRHLIASPVLETRDAQAQPPRRRSAWASASIWRTRRA
jgi:putative nucleotidyltransferase with HDIG domain